MDTFKAYIQCESLNNNSIIQIAKNVQLGNELINIIESLKRHVGVTPEYQLKQSVRNIVRNLNTQINKPEMLRFLRLFLTKSTDIPKYLNIHFGNYTKFESIIISLHAYVDGNILKLPSDITELVNEIETRHMLNLQDYMDNNEPPDIDE